MEWLHIKGEKEKSKKDSGQELLNSRKLSMVVMNELSNYLILLMLRKATASFKKGML